MCDKVRTKVSLLGPNIPIYVEAVHEGGLQIFDLLDLLESDFRPQDGKYDFLGGVNNLSEKHATGKITARYDDVGHLVMSMFEKLNIARNMLFKYTYRPVICQLVGLHFDKYNELKDDQMASQQIIDEGIPLLNHALHSLNKDIEAASPWLGSSIHAIIHKKYHHKYMRLHDGLHPTEELKEIWSKEIANAILKNYSWT